MPAYVLTIRESPVRDPEAMKRYFTALSSQKNADLRPLVGYGAQTPLEGTPPDGVVILEFPDVAAAERWYHSEEYQAAAKDRMAAADYRVLIVEGFSAPARSQAASDS